MDMQIIYVVFYDNGTSIHLQSAFTTQEDAMIRAGNLSKQENVVRTWYEPVALNIRREQ